MKKKRSPSAASNVTRRRIRSVSSGRTTKKANSRRTRTLKLAIAEPAATGESLKKETAAEPEVDQTASWCQPSFWRFGY